jgi:hypothetical protein
VKSQLVFEAATAAVAATQIEHASTVLIMFTNPYQTATTSSLMS